MVPKIHPEGVRWTTPGGGPTLWLELPAAIDLAELAAALAARRVYVDQAGNISTVLLDSTQAVHDARADEATETTETTETTEVEPATTA